MKNHGGRPGLRQAPVQVRIVFSLGEGTGGGGGGGGGVKGNEMKKKGPRTSIEIRGDCAEYWNRLLEA